MVIPTECPFCGNMIGDCRSPMGCEVCHPPYPDSLRCLITGNPCGTDTWEIHHACPCQNCQEWMKEKHLL